MFKLNKHEYILTYANHSILLKIRGHQQSLATARWSARSYQQIYRAFQS